MTKEKAPTTDRGKGKKSGRKSNPTIDTSPDSHDDPEWLDFLAAVRAAVEANKQALERRSRSRRWQTCAWEFTKRLRKYRMVKDLSGEEAAELVEVALAEIHGVEKEEFLWQQVFGDNDSEGDQVDPYTDFLYAWDNCQQPGSGALEEAVERARENPRDPEYFGLKFKGLKHEPFRLFLTIAEELQTTRGQHPIFLPEHLLGEVLKVSHHQIGRWRWMGKRYGFLTEVTPHGPGRATEFLFLIPEEGQDSRTVYPESQSNRKSEQQTSRWPDSQKDRFPHPQRNKPSEIHEDDEIQF